MPRKKKEEIISFKVDGALAEAIQRAPNRSEFIRGAILAALDNACPLCQGTGLLSPDQKKHWEDFRRRHPVRECRQCHAVHLECSATAPDTASPHPGGRKKKAGAERGRGARS
jgi:hypothetical protein